MNVGAIGSFAGGLAGGFQEQQAAAAKNRYYSGLSDEAAARAGALRGGEARAQQQFTSDLAGLNNLRGLMQTKGIGHPDTQAAFQSFLGNTLGPNHSLTQVVAGTTPANGAMPLNAGQGAGTAAPSGAPDTDANSGGQVMP